jgi:hypothetical protein
MLNFKLIFFMNIHIYKYINKKVLFRDGANVLGALASAQRIYDNKRCWPHRDLFPLPFVLTKEVY